MLAGLSGVEQEFFQRVNRFRDDPQGEYGRFLRQTTPQLLARDADVQANLDFFGVDGPTLRRQWDGLQPAPPLAWNADLQEAAEGHNALMVASNTQSHQIGSEPALGQRLRDAGYAFQRASENVFAYCQSIHFCHAGLAIDWGNGPQGLQNPPGHRDTLLDPGLRELGIAVTATGRSGNGQVGPLVATQDFGTRAALSPQVVGAVFADQNGSGWYDAGEGHRDVTIEWVATAGSDVVKATTSWTAGGYQVELPSGTYEATLQVGNQTFVRGGIAVGSVNRWWNLETTAQSTPPQAKEDAASVWNDQATLLDVLANDVARVGRLQGASLRVEQAETAEGSWENVAGAIRFTPAATAGGYAENRYRVADASGAVSEWVTVRVMLLTPGAAPWQNALDPADVDADGQVLAIDALHVINAMNRLGTAYVMPTDPQASSLTRFVDVDGDGRLYPIDALRVINVLNRRPGAGGGAEGEAAPSLPGTLADDADLALTAGIDPSSWERWWQRVRGTAR
jgi:hypothetical protein